MKSKAKMGLVDLKEIIEKSPLSLRKMVPAVIRESKRAAGQRKNIRVNIAAAMRKKNPAGVETL